MRFHVKHGDVILSISPTLAGARVAAARYCAAEVRAGRPNPGADVTVELDRDDHVSALIVARMKVRAALYELEAALDRLEDAELTGNVESLASTFGILAADASILTSQLRELGVETADA